MESINIVIVGGGMVGLATALALSKAGFADIGLIEQQSFPVFSDDSERSMSTRVSAITPASMDLFKQIGVWERLPASRLGMIDSIQVWEQYDKPMLFTASSARVPALGYIVENDLLVAELAKCVREHDNIQLLLASKVQTLARAKDGYIITFEDGRQLHTHLIIGADGANSWVRRQLDIPVNVHDYRQTAIVANITTELPHQHRARQGFNATSTCAFLPLADLQQISLVWSVDNAIVDSLLTLSPNMFAERLAERMHHCLGELQLQSERQHFPLISRRAVNYSQAHVALVGDAARSVHPLAGQGVNLGFMDVTLLVDTLRDAKAQGRQIADAYVLKRYERAAKANAERFLWVIDGLYRLFKVDNPLVNRVRQIGFQGVARCEPALSWLMRQTMGL